MPRLLEYTPDGLHCAIGGFTIDPTRPVARAIITHAHADHLHKGCRSILTSASGARLVRARVGARVEIQELPFGESITIHGIRLSLHPAGHILGSAQVRLEYQGEVWVVTGDYKRTPDPTCEPFEPLRCDILVTECTFGLPAYRWPPVAEVRQQIHQWWQVNQQSGHASLLVAYPLGKAQRLLALLDSSIGPVVVHPDIERFTKIYSQAGIPFPPFRRGNATALSECRSKAMFIAPPGVATAHWQKKLAPHASAFVSGWVTPSPQSPWRGCPRGFALSDHADWDELICTIRESGAREIWAVHGQTSFFAEWLNHNGWTALDPASRSNR